MPLKTTKDTNAPKKPLSAYLLFSADERPKLKASGLDNFAEMSKALGAAWKQADAKIKSHYEKEHEREKLRYENELKEYEKSGQPAPSSKSAQKTQPASSKIKTTTTTTTTKKTAPSAKTVKPKSDEEEEEDDDDDDDDDGDNDDDDEQSESEEEVKKPAAPVKNSRKKN